MAKHVNPKSQNAKRDDQPKSGLARRGNSNAAEQARKNFPHPVKKVVKAIKKSGGSKSSTSSSNRSKSSTSSSNRSKPEVKLPTISTSNVPVSPLNKIRSLKNTYNTYSYSSNKSIPQVNQNNKQQISLEEVRQFNNDVKQNYHTYGSVYGVRGVASPTYTMRKLYKKLGLKYMKNADVKRFLSSSPYKESQYVYKTDTEGNLITKFDEIKARVAQDMDTQVKLAVAMTRPGSETVQSAYSLFSAYTPDDIARIVQKWEGYNDEKGNYHPGLINGSDKELFDWIGIEYAGEKDQDGNLIPSVMEGRDQDIVEERYQAYLDWYKYNFGDEAFADFNKLDHVWLPQVQEYEPGSLKSPPPWLVDKMTAQDIVEYEFYTKYANRTRQAELNDLDEYKTLLADTEKNNINGEIGVAMSHFGKEGVIDSYTDLLTSYNGAYNDMITRMKEGDLSAASDYYKTLLRNTKNYFRDYWYNPLKTGHTGTFVWNRVAGLLDALDYVPRYARAVGAAKTEIGGMWESEEGSLFMGQEVFWYKDDEESKEKQKFFMENGGRELLHAEDPSHVTEEYGSSYSDKDKFWAQLREAFSNSGKYTEADLMEVYNGLMNGIEDARKGDRKKVIENLLKVASTPGADFNADSGSLATDVIVEASMDPSLVLGGLARSALKSGVRDVARSALKDGFTAIRKSDDFFTPGTFINSIQKPNGKGVIASPFKLSGLNSDQIKLANRAIKRFENRNDFKDIIFKNEDDVRKSLNILVEDLHNIDERIIPNIDKDAFVNQTVKSIMDRSTHANANIINSKQVINPDMLKVAYYLNKGVDTIDMSLLKGALPEYFLLRGGFKGGKWIYNESAVGTFITQRRLMRKVEKYMRENGNAHFTSTATIDDIRDSLKDVNDNPQRSYQARVDAIRNARQRVDNLTVEFEDIIRNFGDERITADEAEALLQSTLNKFIGNHSFSTFDELVEYLEHQPDLLTGDVLEALTVARSSHDTLKDFIDNSRMGNIVRDNISGTGAHKHMTQPDVEKAVKAMENENVTRQSLKILNGKEIKQLCQRYSVDFSRYTRIQNLLQNPRCTVQEVRDAINKTIIEGQTRTSISASDLNQLVVLRDVVTKEYSSLTIDHNEAVVQLQLDKLGFFDAFLHSDSMSELMTLYTRQLKPSIDELLKNHPVSSLSNTANPAFYNSLRAFQQSMERMRLFELFKAQLRPQSSGLTEDQMWLVLDTFFGLNYGKGTTAVQDALRSIRGTDSPVDLAFYTNTGGSKLGIRNAAARLRTVNSDIRDSIFDSFVDDFDNDKELRDWVSDLVNNSAENAENYCKLQIIQAIALDPSIIKEYNQKSQIQPVIFYHLNTSGLNRNADVIREASAITWQPISEDKVSLREIFEQILNNDEAVWTRSVKLNADEIPAPSREFLDKIYDVDTIMAATPYDVKAKWYMDKYVTSDPTIHYSEEDLLTEFIDHINTKSTVVRKEGLLKRQKNRAVPPIMVVHDYEGFNFPFLNNRIDWYKQQHSEHNNIQNFSKFEWEQHSENTFHRLRNLTNDRAFTYDERQNVTRILRWFDQRSAGLRTDLSFTDVTSISSSLEHLIFTMESSASLDSDIAAFKKLFANTDTETMIEGLSSTASDISELNAYASRQFMVQNLDQTKIKAGYSSINDKDFLNKLNETNYEAIQNICRALGLDFNMQRFPSVSTIGGLSNDLAEIDFNTVYDSDRLIQAFLHELTHYNIRYPNANDSTFYDTLAITIQQKDPALYNHWLQVKQGQYAHYQNRYATQQEFIDSLHEELAAQVSGFILSDPQYFAQMRTWIQGSSNVDERMLTILDNFHILQQNLNMVAPNPGTLRQAEQDISKLLLQDSSVSDFFYNNIRLAIQNNDELTNKVMTQVTAPNGLIRNGENALSSMNSPLVNVKAKNSLYEINSYFDIFLRDESMRSARVTQRDLGAMQDITDFVSSNKQYHISMHASQFLESYGNTFKSILEALKNMEVAHQLNNKVDQDQLSFLRYLIIPENTVDAYLICKYLYDNILHFWLDPTINTRFTSELSNLKKTGKLTQKFYDEYEARILVEFVEQFDMKTAIGNINNLSQIDRGLSILRGDFDSEIYLQKKNIIHDIQSNPNPSPYDDAWYSVVRKYKNAMDKLRADHTNFKYLLDDLRLNFIDKESHQTMIMAMNKLGDFIDALPEDEKLLVKFFDEVIHTLDNELDNYMNLYHIRKLRSKDGKLNELRLMSELLFNPTHHIMLDTSRIPDELFDEFKRFVDDTQSPHIEGHFEGNGQYFVVGLLKDINGQSLRIVDEELPDGSQARRIISDDFIGNAYTRNTDYEAIHYPSYEELPLKKPDPKLKDLYDAYIALWRDAAALSRDKEGYASHGTLGHLVTQSQLDDYIKNLPPGMSEKYILPDVDTMQEVIYNPGFIKNGNQDSFVNLISTLERLHKTAETGVLVANYMFGENVPNRFSDLIQSFSDQEVFDVMRSDLNWVVVDVRSARSRYGFNIVDVPIRTKQDVALLRNNPHAIILPYDSFKQIQANVNVYDNGEGLQIFHKMLLVQKAFNLCRLSTVIRNFIDASMRNFANDKYGSGTENLSMVAYHSVAIKHMYQFYKLLLKEGDSIPSGPWASVCARNNIDMSYEDYMLFKGIYDANTYLSKPVVSNKPKFRHTVSQTNGRGLDNMKAETAWRYLTMLQSNKKIRLLIDEKDFLRIYDEGFSPEDSQLLRKQYQESLNTLYNNLGSGDISYTSLGIKMVFQPFNVSELLAKYSQLLYMRDNGFATSDSMKKLHFSQAQEPTANRFASQIELIFPFATYNYKTIQFWMELIEKNPRYYRLLFEHMYGSIYENNIETSLAENGMWDYEQDRNTQQGSLPVFGLDGVYFKLNPSVLGAFNLFLGGPSYAFNNNLNAPIRMMSRYSLYMFGFNSKDFLGTIDLDMSDEKFNDQLLSIVPGVSTVYDIYKNFWGSDSYRWEQLEGGVPKFLVKYFPKLFSKVSEPTDRAAMDYDEFRKELEAQDKFYDLNLRKVVKLSEKNEFGLNNPNLTFEDTNALMFARFGLVWDANVRDWVAPENMTEGGLNQEFDFDNDPEAWDKLEAEYKKRGMAFDYNIGKFVPKDQLSSGGLNDPNNDFQTVKELYAEKWGKYYDANQNKFVTPDQMIPGGLNDIQNINSVQDWYKLQAYRKALFGETYIKDPHYENGKLVKGRFEKTTEPTVVTLKELVGSDDDANYYHQLGVSKMLRVVAKDIIYKDGYFKTRDGKFVLLNNKEYNERVMNEVYEGGGWRGFGYRRFRSGWRDFGNKTYDKNPKLRKKRTITFTGYKNNTNYNIGYQYEYEFKYDYSLKSKYNYNYIVSRDRVVSQMKRNRFMNIIHPYGGDYNKFTFYNR